VLVRSLVCIIPSFWLLPRFIGEGGADIWV
jgi:hypothetical protein